MSAGPLLCRLRGVSVEVGRRPDAFRLEAAAFDVRRGDRLALVSPSGSGKSLFLELLGLARAPGSAERFVLGAPAGGAETRDVVALWETGPAQALSRERRRSVGFLLQSGGLLPYLSIRENVALPARLAGRDPADAQALLEALGLGELARRRPHELSGGQRQRAALARAIAARPTLLLADEPTASLDARNADRVMHMLAELPRTGLVGAVVIATHDGARAAANGFTQLGLEPRSAAGVAIGAVQPRALAA